MANSFTQAGLIIQVTGENSGTWGGYTDTNENITTRLVGGNVAEDMSSGNVTPANVDGVADDGKNMVFICSGTLTANRSLILPTKNRVFVVTNNTTGSFTLTVKTASGTGIVIQQNGTAFLYCDGTNIVRATDVTGIGAVSSSVATVFTAQQNFGTQTLTDASSISWNLATQQIAKVTLAGNRTLSNPTNMADGGTYILAAIQDATGNRTLSYDTAYNFGALGAPTLSTTANAKDYLTYISDGTKMNFVGIQKGY